MSPKQCNGEGRSAPHLLTITVLCTRPTPHYIIKEIKYIKISETRIEVRRTLPVKLLVADSDRDALLDTIDQYKHCANEASDHCSVKNVAVRCCRRLLRRNQTGGDGGASVNIALNGGTMTVTV
jgi:hypothetical protein